ncbi:MAG: tetratricopeptide repeat protein [Janthinobacterium lividum]
MPPTSNEGSVAQANAASDRIRHAEDLLEQGDFKAAEPELLALANGTPTDARLQYDLGFTEEHNGEDEAAAAAYTAAITADAKLAEPQVALGLLQARQGHADEARLHLDSAVKLASISPALHARALRALARLNEAAQPEQAREDLLQAAQLTGEQPGDAELTARLAAHAGDSVNAEMGYRRLLEQSPGDIAATGELAAVLQKEGKLPEADALLTPALAAHPDDLRLVAQAASLYAAEGRAPEAISLLQHLRTADPNAANNASLTRLLAHLELISGDAAGADPLYRALITADPDNPLLLDDFGSTLVREQHFAEAQTVFTKAVSLRSAFHDDEAWGEANGHLAFAASRNHQPQVALQALAARATVLPNSAASLFLEATAHDALHQNRQAAQNYRAFLAAAGGKLPDEEFEARHRLIALEHEH